MTKQEIIDEVIAPSGMVLAAVVYFVTLFWFF